MTLLSTQSQKEMAPAYLLTGRKASPVARLESLYTNTRQVLHLPEKRVHRLCLPSRPDIIFQELNVSCCMLPSINDKHDRRQRVRPEYRIRELMEIERLRAQRDYLGGWPLSRQDRYTIFYVFSFPTELKQDGDNFMKATCDLLGKGRYESRGSGKKRYKLFVDHAQLVENDNRVLHEGFQKHIERNYWSQMCEIAIFQYATRDSQSQTLFNEIYERGRLFFLKYAPLGGV